MPNLHQLTAFLLQSSDLPTLPIGRLEQISITALETAIIWILWRAYREKDKQLQDQTAQIIASDTKIAATMERVERLLDSLKRGDVH